MNFHTKFRHLKCWEEECCKSKNFRIYLLGYKSNSRNQSVYDPRDATKTPTPAVKLRNNNICPCLIRGRRYEAQNGLFHIYLDSYGNMELSQNQKSTMSGERPL